MRNLRRYLPLVLAGCVVAGPLQLHYRQTQESAPTTTPSTTPSPSSTESPEQPSNGLASSTIHFTSSSEPSSVSTSSITAASPVASTESVGNNNVTLSANVLPLEPRLTPGWGVAGALLLVTGAVYTLIGIKNPRIQTFFSTAYLGAVCTTILIVYLMYPPIPDAIQGAYVVASVMAGVLMGGAATIFKELTEGLGCLLGGFCLGMWLLTLKSGGLLTNSNDKIIFVTVFCVVGFATYFSRYTRGYALIGFISFSGATVTVLGIDCFSRAGLKEFWAYIWNINPYLFPVDTTTYPLTKGVTVEIALIVILAIVGVISQLRLWRVIQQHRAKKEEKQAEIERQRDLEETAIGQQIEEANAREKKQWEKRYGDHAVISTRGSEERLRPGGQEAEDPVRSGHPRSIRSQEALLNEPVELSAISSHTRPASPSETNQLNTADFSLPINDRASTSTVRVASEAGTVAAGIFQSNSDEKDLTIATVTSPESRQAEKPTLDEPAILETVATPEIVPLPFTIPQAPDREAEEDDVCYDDRSSFATYADDDDDRSMIVSKRSSRASLSNRFSVGSNHLLRKLSIHSNASHSSKTATGAGKVQGQRHTSHEPLKDFSVGDQVVDDAFPASELPEDLAFANLHAEQIDSVITDKYVPEMVMQEGNAKKRSRYEMEHGDREVRERAQADASTGNPEDGAYPEAAPLTLSADRLPARLSRVALSYRTNEWAKHLSEAEAPELERLNLHRYNDSYLECNTQEEAATVVDVHNLQRTDAGIPTTNMATTFQNLSSTSTSTLHDPSLVPSVAQTLHGPSQAQEMQNGSHSVAPAVPLAALPSQNQSKSYKRSSHRLSKPATSPTIVEETSREILRDAKAAVETETPAESTPNNANLEVPDRPPVPGVVSHTSPQTLLGQREVFLRNRSTSMLLPQGGAQLTDYPPRSPSEMGGRISPHKHQNSVYAPIQGIDMDDLTLAQRKQLMRQDSQLSQYPSASRDPSVIRTTPSPVGTTESGFRQSRRQPITAGMANFDSHQPQRISSVRSQAQREMSLANFRQNVAADLRSSSSVQQSQSFSSGPRGYVPTANLINQVNPGPMGSRGPTPKMIHSDINMAESLERSRNTLMSLKEQEIQEKEMERYQKQMNDRAFEEMMRRGDLLDAHREALRKMQGSAK